MGKKSEAKKVIEQDEALRFAVKDLELKNCFVRANRLDSVYCKATKKTSKIESFSGDRVTLVLHPSEHGRIRRRSLLRASFENDYLLIWSNGATTRVSFDEKSIGYPVEEAAAEQDRAATPEIDPAPVATEPEPEPEQDTGPGDVTGAELATVNKWPIYQFKAAKVDTVRDLDLAKRAGLANPRDIRTTIEGLIGDGEIGFVTGVQVGVATAGANLEPLAIKVHATYTSGKGRLQSTEEYHLTETAAMLVVMRLRTAGAAQVRRSMVTAFALLRQGRLEAAHHVATGGAPVAGSRADLELQLAAVDSLIVEGVIDSKTGAVHRAMLIGRMTGIDLSVTPSVTFGRWAPPVLPDLAPGDRVVVSKPVDTTDHLFAKQIAELATGDGPPIQVVLVGMVARALGLHGEAGAPDAAGRWLEVLVNGEPKKKTWIYSRSAVSRILPVLRRTHEIFTNQRNEKPAVRIGTIQAIEQAIREVDAASSNTKAAAE